MAANLRNELANTNLDVKVTVYTYLNFITVSLQYRNDFMVILTKSIKSVFTVNIALCENNI